MEKSHFRSSRAIHRKKKVSGVFQPEFAIRGGGREFGVAKKEGWSAEDHDFSLAAGVKKQDASGVPR